MLRLLLNAQSAKNGSNTSDTPQTESRTVADKLARRSNMLTAARGQPKSVCTSLKDLCEL